MSQTGYLCHKLISKMNLNPKTSIEPVEVLMVATPETAGSALYGMLDVLSASGNIWGTLNRSEEIQNFFRVRVISTSKKPFSCGNGIPVSPDFSVADQPSADIVILSELWLGPDENLHGRHPELINWITKQYSKGAILYSACSGSVMLAETGLLDDRQATSHWGYEDLFKKSYPKVRFDAAPNRVYADAAGRIVTAGGTTSWHDLALHIIARHASPGEALRIAKVYLLKWHPEGQLPYTGLVRRTPHADSVVKKCETWLSQHYREIDAIKQIVNMIDVPERSLKRRFKSATGNTLIEHLQNLRIEESKRLLENDGLPIDEVKTQVIPASRIEHSYPIGDYYQ